MLSTLINGQKAYGKEYSIEDTYEYYRMKLEKKFSSAQVMYGIDKYTDRKNDIPAPSDIINILQPEAPQISATEYLHAKKQWELNGYGQFCDHLDVIKAYEAQTQTKREDFKIENQEIKSLVRNSVKRIN